MKKKRNCGRFSGGAVRGRTQIGPTHTQQTHTANTHNTQNQRFGPIGLDRIGLQPNSTIGHNRKNPNWPKSNILAQWQGSWGDEGSRWEARQHGFEGRARVTTNVIDTDMDLTAPNPSALRDRCKWVALFGVLIGLPIPDVNALARSGWPQRQGLVVLACVVDGRCRGWQLFFLESEGEKQSVKSRAKQN